MNDLEKFQLSEEQFGPFWRYVKDENVTDIDYNGKNLWVTDLSKGHYKAEEEVTEQFLDQFTHNVANCVNKQFNRANKILEADTKDLRISILHNSVATTGTSICIRKSPAIVRNHISDLIEKRFCPEEILHLLINCVQARMNFVCGGEPGHGKTEFIKFLMQFIHQNERVITIEDSLEIHYGDINPGSDYVELRIEDDFDYTAAIKASLRQNPKWLVLSEARSTEVTSLIEQWSTGVKGFTTIHLDDLRKLPDRILNMMNDEKDVARLENRIYSYVNVGILVRRIEQENGQIRRYIDQICFYDRDNNKNRTYMLVEDGEIISRELPKGIIKHLKQYGIENPFICEDMKRYIEEGR